MEEDSVSNGGGIDENEGSISENYTPIQLKKRLPQQICISCTALCPSMDLVAIGIVGKSSARSIEAGGEREEALNKDNGSVMICAESIIVYRTISWQKMFAITQSDISNAASSIKNSTHNPDSFTACNIINAGDQKNDSEITETNINMSANDDFPGTGPPVPMQAIGATRLTWSPDGRILGIALYDGSTVFYDIELCASPGVPPTPIYALAPPPFKIPFRVGVATQPTSALEATDLEATASSSPPVTRSMTNARRKRLMRMVGKTPSYDSSFGGISSRTRSNTRQDHTQIQNSRYSLSNCIKAMHWQRIRMKDTEEWSFRKYYLDRSTYFLPPCHYTKEGAGSGGVVNGMDYGGNSSLNSNSIGVHGNDDGDSANYNEGNRHAPKGVTPLSILMTLSDAGLSIYLNGRYRIISIESNKYLDNDVDGNNNGQPIRSTREIISTSDFHILTSKNIHATTNTIKLYLHRLPSLIPHRYNLQFISYSFGTITSHLKTMTKGIEDTYSAWSASLRQLDMKFDQLLNLFIKYNVISQSLSEEDKISGMRLELLNYILGGHSSRSGDSSNAMDQFFTHPLMNDQLLIRLFRSLVANVAGVEGLLRKTILGPVRSLVYDVGELNGLVKVMNAERLYNNDDTGNDNHYISVDRDEPGDGLPALMSNDTCLRLSEASSILFTLSEQCVSQTVELRHRLECMTKWIRGTASQVKARGTATDSVQRENARKRRVSEQVVRKVSDFLSTPLKSAPGELAGKRGSTESVLGILLSDYFSKDRVFLEKTRSPLQRKDHFYSDGFNSFLETPSLKTALDVTRELSFELFDEPRKVMMKEVDGMEFILEEGLSCENEIISALHSRFSNKIIQEMVDEEDGEKFARSAHWTIVANSCASTHRGCRLVQLTAIPVEHIFLGERKHSNSHHCPSFYMTAFLKLPESCSVTDIKFYGDDGNSTLTSETSPSYEEGRQAIAMLLERNVGDESKEELWLVDYDEIPFRDTHEHGQSARSKWIIPKFDRNTDVCVQLTNDERMDDDRHLVSKWRSMRSKSPEIISSLMMSGSRGIGGVICASTSTIDLFDLEEDEASDEDSNDDSE